MQTGDVVYFKKQDTFISRMIARLTESDFTHVGLALDEKTIIEADRFVNTRVVHFEPDDNLHVIYRSDRMNDTIKEKIQVNALHFKNFPYDYLQIVQFTIRLLFKWNISFLNRSSRLICSELIDYTFIASGLPRANGSHVGDVMVKDLIELYELKEVSAWRER